jgi:2-amino-4-hydroxy-6-hydroxymethyldihydropteridine diphosphokinase
MLSSRLIWLAFGANVKGLWGAPGETLARAVAELGGEGLQANELSDVVVSQPVGRLRQPAFHNAVAAFRGDIGPARLLWLVKALERRAGRKPGVRWGPRPLDIDIIDFGGRRVSMGCRHTRPGQLVLPHPEAERRGFVLVPLAAIAPHWRHPRLGVRGRDLIRRQPRLLRGHATTGRPLARR